MTKHYVVAVLEVEKAKEDMTLCKTGCMNGFGMPLLEAINNSCIITSIIITPHSNIGINDVMTKLGKIIKRG